MFFNLCPDYSARRSSLTVTTMFLSNRTACLVMVYRTAIIIASLVSPSNAFFMASPASRRGRGRGIKTFSRPPKNSWTTQTRETLTAALDWQLEVREISSRIVIGDIVSSRIVIGNIFFAHTQSIATLRLAAAVHLGLRKCKIHHGGWDFLPSMSRVNQPAFKNVHKQNLTSTMDTKTALNLPCKLKLVPNACATFIHVYDMDSNLSLAAISNDECHSKQSLVASKIQLSLQEGHTCHHGIQCRSCTRSRIHLHQPCNSLHQNNTRATTSDW